MYRKYGTQGSLKIDINDFFMHMDIPTGDHSNSTNYWVKMSTYARNQKEHNMIQDAIDVDWMLLEAKR